MRRLAIVHVDTSVILGALQKKEKFKYECKNFLNLLGNRFTGEISLSVVGEFFSEIETKGLLKSERFWLFEMFDDLIERRNLRIVPVTMNMCSKAVSLRLVDFNVEDSDALHLAVASLSNARIFITLDKDLVENHYLEKALSLKIRHPKQYPQA